ncbi:MAG: hypothetical protein ACRD10_11505 [Terriglobia bacterium]
MSTLPPVSSASAPDLQRLDSWKEIGAYLKRHARTAQRWEREERLPVHRHLHDKQGSVYAYKSEIDLWWTNRRSQLEPEEDKRTISRIKLWYSLAAAMVIIAGISAASIWQAKRWQATPPPSGIVVVFPFHDRSPGSNKAWFAAGITEELATELAQLRPVRVAPARSLMHAPQGDIAREMHADAVIQGVVVCSGDQVRITAQLTGVRTDRPLWMHSYHGDIYHVLTMRDEVAHAIAQDVQSVLKEQK